jgi:hypothetical protein
LKGWQHTFAGLCCHFQTKHGYLDRFRWLEFASFLKVQQSFNIIKRLFQDILVSIDSAAKRRHIADHQKMSIVTGNVLDYSIMQIVLTAWAILGPMG